MNDSMDRDSNRCHCYLSNTRELCPVHEREVLPLFISDSVENHSIMVGPARLDKAGLSIVATEGRTVHIPPVGSVPFKLWGVRPGYMLSFVVGIIWTMIILTIIGGIA